MKKQHLFTLDLGLIQELHRRVARGHRSQFVETAVRNRLNNEEEYNAGDISDRQLMALLHTRLANRTDAAAYMVREFLVRELGQ
jgi:metal-responsive CopG/Arc/MetJ family transcriptional regulator|tara:strand:+ start:205 stop:456 length:252 start_codon:yes stop_codon:yes gene_type:complete